MAPVVDFFLVWWLRSGRCFWSKLRRHLFERGYLKVALPAVKSVEEIETCLKQITWTQDGPLHLFDCISYPQTTWAKKRDDCDGFASLAAALLQQSDPESRPVLLTVGVRPFQESHTVCVFAAPPDSLRFFDNDSLVSLGHRSYQEIAEHVSQRASKLVCWDTRNPLTLELIEFHHA